MSRTDMVLIPIPALEQHGLQGPIGTDYYTGVEQSKLIAQRTDILVAPILLVGQSPYHLAFPGSIALSAETLQRVYWLWIRAGMKESKILWAKRCCRKLAF